VDGVVSKRVFPFVCVRSGEPTYCYDYYTYEDCEPGDEDCYCYFECYEYEYEDIIYPACEGLTASICQDNVTCTGKDACTDATVGAIHLGCNGFEACKEAGKSGYLGTINNGCEGKNACTKTGYRGNLTLIRNSCQALNAFNYIGARACAFAASYGGKIN